MKALPKRLLRLTLFGIAVTSLLSVQPAQAFTIRLDQVGANVVATGSGAINLTGLTLFGGGFNFNLALVQGSNGTIQTGPTGFVSFHVYSGFTGPTSFGSGGQFFANTGSGDIVGVFNAPSEGIVLPQGYVSNAPLSDSMTFNSATFASLGLTPGTYRWTWGSMLPNQNFTLIIGPAGVPDGGSTVSLLGCALLGLAALRRKLSC
jgi:hypothetical protein